MGATNQTAAEPDGRQASGRSVMVDGRSMGSAKGCPGTTTGDGFKHQTKIVTKVKKSADESHEPKKFSASDDPAHRARETTGADVTWISSAGGVERSHRSKRRRSSRLAARSPGEAMRAEHKEGVLGATDARPVTAVASEESIPGSNPGADPDFKARTKRGFQNPYGLTPGYSPYPHREVPSPESCEDVYRILADLHGEVTQPQEAPLPSLEVSGCGEVPSVLDALMRTILSGNTLMARADGAIRGLVKRFGIQEDGVGAGSINWNRVRLASLEDLVAAIKPAGCAQIKGKHIKAILDSVHQENVARSGAQVGGGGEDAEADILSEEGASGGHKQVGTKRVSRGILSLDHFHGMSKDEAMAGLLKYPGIGVKTAACVALFCLRIPCFAVDTHVHKFCQWLAWVPAGSSELDSFNHGDFKVPDHLKYGLHQLFIRHGQQCFRCRKVTKPGTRVWDGAPDCPLERLLDRSKGSVRLADESVEKAGPAV